MKMKNKGLHREELGRHLALALFKNDIIYNNNNNNK